MTTERVPRFGEPLTSRELQVVCHVADGLLNPAIGEAMGLSPRTVKNHLDRIGLKLGTGDRAGIVGAVFLTRQLQVVPSSRVVVLDERESAVLVRVARGWSNPQIAADLGLSGDAVSWAVRVLLRKLGVPGRAGAVRAALECGALTLVPRQAPESPVGPSGGRSPSGARKSASGALRPVPGAIPSRPSGADAPQPTNGAPA